ncbi:MAG TPA: LysR family transcriptional regulator [Acidimicrobiales bacterium]|nr:LysR family transcriptional regulator [Acidimicrobiales bacterium]
MESDPPPGSEITLAQLRAFVAVARHEHVTRAAEELGCSQPAVSHQLRSLEALVGLPLLERVGRRVRLTAEGAALVPAASGVLGALRALEEVVASRRSLGSGRLRLAASNTVGIYRLPRWLAPFVARHPALEVQARLVNTARALELLERAEVDCALIEGPGECDGFEVLTIERDELVLVASSGHPLAQVAPVTADDLAEHRYLAREDGSGTEALAAQLLGAAYRRGPVLELDQIDAVRGGVLAGIGYAVLPRLAVEGDIAAGRITCLATARAALERELRAVRRRRSHPPALAAFWRHLAGLVGAASPT